jgi:hypothetical protein
MAGEETGIGDFLMKLSEDREGLRRYQENPEDVLETSGLSERQKEVLRSGDIRRIREAVEAEYPGADVLWIIDIQIRG